MTENHLTEANQYLTFTLGNEAFAIEITNIREVVDYCNITKIPRTPEHLCGVINLRGNVISIVDLRLKLGMNAIQKTADTCIVITEINMGEDLLQMGLLTDSVQEVIYIAPEQIEPPPQVGTKLNTEFVKGIGKRNDDFVIILNIEKVLGNEEASQDEASEDQIDS